MANEIDISTVAHTRIISLFALFVALGQRFQKSFATAEGHRRCQEPVIGTWAHWTIRWSHFWFETVFTSPKLTLHSDQRLPMKVRRSLVPYTLPTTTFPLQVILLCHQGPYQSHKLQASKQKLPAPKPSATSMCAEYCY